MTSTMSLTEQLWDVVEHHENADHKAAAPVPSCQSIRKSLSALLNEHHGVQANEAANECIFYDVENISLRFSTVKKHLNCFLVGYLTHPLDTHSMVFSIPTGGAIVGRNQQLSLTTDGGTLQVTWSIGDADVIGYMGKDTFKKAFL